MTEPGNDESIRAERGARAEASDPERLHAAIALAIDYRGDVTIERRDDAPPVAGYLYDADRPLDAPGAALRLLPADGGSAHTIPLAGVHAITFTGRDTAEGKSFETWIRKYAEKKRKGEEASIYSEE